MTDLNGKTALITGSTSGIGKVTVLALADRRAHVLFVGRDEQRAKDVLAEIEGKGGSAVYRLTTLSDLASARDRVEWAADASDGHANILINNTSQAEYRQLIDVRSDALDAPSARSTTSQTVDAAPEPLRC